MLSIQYYTLGFMIKIKNIKPNLMKKINCILNSLNNLFYTRDIQTRIYKITFGHSYVYFIMSCQLAILQYITVTPDSVVKQFTRGTADNSSDVRSYYTKLK